MSPTRVVQASRRVRRAAVAAVGLAVAAVTAVAACSMPGHGDDGAARDKTIHVAAAASLTDVFGELGTAYEQAHPGTKIVFDFGSSTALAQQLPQRSDVGLFASADRRSMDTATASGAAHDPAPLARNRLTVAVPKGNPGGVTALRDLERPATRVALCQPEVPCGRATTRVFAAAALPEPVGALRQPDVRATLGMILSGEADVALVYCTDVHAVEPQVETVPLDDAVAPAGDTSYFLAPVGDGGEARDTVSGFRDFVLGPQGRAALERAGFLPPVA